MDGSVLEQLRRPHPIAGWYELEAADKALTVRRAADDIADLENAAGIASASGEARLMQQNATVAEAEHLYALFAFCRSTTQRRQLLRGVLIERNVDNRRFVAGCAFRSV